MLKIKPSSQPPRPLVPRASRPVGPEPTAKKARSVNHSRILITREASVVASEGLEVLLGTYSAQEAQLNHSMVVYKKLQEVDGEDPIFLYFWGNSKDDRGWWLGHEVNGAEAYCWAPSEGFPPPKTGWRIPADDQPPVDDLRVIYPAPSSDQGGPEELSQPKTVPPRTGSSSSQQATSVRDEIERLKASSSQPSQPKTVPPKANGVAERSSVGEAASARSDLQRLTSLNHPKRVAAKAGADVPSAKAEIERLASLRQPSQPKTVPPKANGVAEGAASAKAKIEQLKASLSQGSQQPKTVPPRAKGVVENSPAAKTLQPRPATVAPGTLRDAAISAGLSSEEAIWLDRFYQNRTLYWRIVNGTLKQTEDLQLVAASKTLIDKS